MQPQVQYVMSHIHSVKPFASRSSPALRREPSSLYDGRPERSNQNWMAKDGRARRNQRYRDRVDNRKCMSKKVEWRAKEIRCSRFSMAVLRAAWVLRAFWSICEHMLIRMTIRLSTYLRHDCYVSISFVAWLLKCKSLHSNRFWRDTDTRQILRARVNVETWG